MKLFIQDHEIEIDDKLRFVTKVTLQQMILEKIALMISETDD